MQRGAGPPVVSFGLGLCVLQVGAFALSLSSRGC